MQVRALHPDAIVLTSAVLQLNSVLLRGGRHEDAGGPLGVVEVRPGEGGQETFLIDSPLLPQELASVPAVVEQSRFPPVSGLLATHADWDHLLGRLAYPGAALGCAESSARRLAAEPGAAQRELRGFDEGLYIERERPLALGAVQALPVPGRCEIGGRELALLATEGHTGDGMALWAPWAGVLVAGDYLSRIEIPMISPGGGVEPYLRTLTRLEELLGEARHVVPGHGPVLDAAVAAEVLAEDRAYLRALSQRGAQAELPPGRRSPEQRRVHERNAAALAA